MFENPPILPLNLYQGIVISTTDPENKRRVKVRVVGIADELWAIPTFPMAGKNSGAFFFPEVGANCLLGFLPDINGRGDLKQAIIICYWYPTVAGAHSEGNPPEKYSLMNTAGTAVQICDDHVELQVNKLANYFLVRYEELKTYIDDFILNVYNVHIHDMTGTADPTTHEVVGVSDFPSDMGVALPDTVASENKTS